MFLTVPPRCLPHPEPEPASFGPDVGLKANQGLSPPPLNNMSTSSSSTMWIIFLWEKQMIGWGQGGKGLRSQSFIGRQMSHVEKKKEYNWRGTGGKAGISETMKRARHGKRSDTRDSFFCGHYGSISEADLANVMWGISATNQSWNLPQSLWQFPAHLNHLSGALLLLLA